MGSNEKDMTCTEKNRLKDLAATRSFFAHPGISWKSPYSCNMHGVTTWKKPKMKKTRKPLFRFLPGTVTNSLFPSNPNMEQQKQSNVPWSSKHPPNIHLVVSPSFKPFGETTREKPPPKKTHGFLFFSVRLRRCFFSHTIQIDASPRKWHLARWQVKWWAFLGGEVLVGVFWVFLMDLCFFW